LKKQELNQMTNNKKYSRAVLIIFTLAALFYNSWPLGYLLNYKTARYDLASDLEFSGQPYDWLFVMGDLLVGACLIVIVIVMRLRLHGEFWSKSLTAVVTGLFIFGLFTATSADAPNTCAPRHISICARVDKASFGPDGVESTLAALGLFSSLVGVNIFNIRTRINKKIKSLSFLMLILWPICGIAFVFAAGGNHDVHLAQQILLIVSGLSMLAIGLNVYPAMGAEFYIKTPGNKAN
jgi:hypothetical protein